ncbi:unnamed protein product, partial [Brassica oleracea]
LQPLEIQTKEINSNSAASAKISNSAASATANTFLQRFNSFPAIFALEIFKLGSSFSHLLLLGYSQQESHFSREP